MMVGTEAASPGEPGQPPHLIAGRQIVRAHYEAVADEATGFGLGDVVQVRRNRYVIVGLTSRMVSSGGDPMLFIPLQDAQQAQFLKDSDAIVRQRARTARNPALNPPGNPGMIDAVTASQTSNPYVNAVLVQVREGFSPDQVAEPIRSPSTPGRKWKRFWLRS